MLLLIQKMTITRRINMNIEQLKVQHVKINNMLSETRALVNTKDFETNSREIAKNISQLAGVLKVHLGAEDRSLYPTLNTSTDLKVKKMAASYISEMGNLSEVYVDFKMKYNTAGKILSDIPDFLKEFDKVFLSLERRMNKEDTELYPLAEKL